MKKLVSCLFFFCLSFQLLGQSGDDVQIIEDPRIEHYLSEFNRISASKTMPQFIYRIQLISTYERNEASGTRSKFRNLYPSEPSFLRHDGVKFLVEAGEFTSKSDAEVMLRDIRSSFTSAFLLPPKRVQ